MYSIYLLNYNNYTNRIILRTPLNTLLSNFTLASYDGINFVEGDGVNTSVVLNKSYELEDAQLFPNYLVAVDDYGKDSRWFIIKTERLRTGQSQFTLHRDLISDELFSVKYSTWLINRGYTTIDNPVWFKQENITTNKVPTKQTLLKDTSGVSWIVGYAARGTLRGTYKASASADETIYATYDSMADFNAATGNNYYAITGGSTRWAITYADSSDKPTDGLVYAWSTGAMSTTFNGTTERIVSNLTKSVALSKTPDLPRQYSGLTLNGYNIMTEAQQAKQRELIGKTVKIGGTTYKINATSVAETERRVTLDYTHSVASLDKVVVYLQTFYSNGTKKYSAVQDILIMTTAPLALQTVYFVSDTLTIADSYPDTTDAIYDVFYAPYISEAGDRTDLIKGYSDIRGEYNLSLMVNIQTTLTAAKIYDLQIVPYCPEPMILNSNGQIDLSKLGSDKYRLSDNKHAIVFFANSCNSTRDLTYKFAASQDKTDYLTKEYVLTSPNFANSYTIPVYENAGVDYFNVDMTLLPYNPWIKVNPNYKYLNGTDFNDATGLVLGGSFQTSQQSDAWQQYLYENSNYKQIFDSTMEYNDEQFKWQQIQSGINAAASAVSTGLAVSCIAGPVGIALGAASAVAGAGDLAISQHLYGVSKDYQTQQFNLQLGNIKSKGNTITKVTAYNYNNKLFPYVTTYEATDTEKKQVKEYLDYYGMNIGTVGQITDYLKPTGTTFVSASLIRYVENENETKGHRCDTNYVQALQAELAQGIYLDSSIFNNLDEDQGEE